MSKNISEYGKCRNRNDDFTRCDLLELFSDLGPRAIIITCKFLFSDNPKHFTFGNIRVFDEIELKKTKYQLTDHVNFPKSIVERYLKLNAEFNHLKFFILCTPETYKHYGVTRGIVM